MKIREASDQLKAARSMPDGQEKDRAIAQATAGVRDAIRARGRELYGLELDYTLGRSDGERVDTTTVERRAALRWQNEILHPEEQAEIALLALRAVARSVNQSRSPRFEDGGSVRLRLTDMLRVAGNEVVAAIYATEDDWSAYLAIKTKNIQAQQRDYDATKQGVSRIRNDLRKYATSSGDAQPKTLDACPYLFEGRDEVAA
jgi:hypothetical protein